MNADVRPLSRSENMARIKGTDTLPEVTLRKLLWAAGIRYRTNFRTPGGKADIALPSKRFAVFVDGCFWHGCPEHYVKPRSRSSYWDAKLTENVERDRRQTQKLLDEDWNFIRVWEHEVSEDAPEVAQRVLNQLKSGRPATWPRWRVAVVEFIDPFGERERRHLKNLLGNAGRIEEGPRITLKIGRVKRSSTDTT